MSDNKEAALGAIEVIKTALSKLRVRSGLQCDSKRLDETWRIGFLYDRDLKWFAVDLHYNSRASRMFLKREDVETRGRSQWLADNTWRLSAAGIVRVEEATVKIMAEVGKRKAAAEKKKIESL